MITLLRPTATGIKDPDQLMAILMAFYNELIANRQPLSPARSPALQAITLSDFAAMRSQVGDVNAIAGPRLCLVAGKLALLDGGQGVFAWDPTATTADDGTNVIAPIGAAKGRWRRVL